MIRPADKEYKDAQKLLPAIDAAEKKHEKQLEPALRELLKIEYRDVVAAANPHLNYIGAQLTSAKGGFALWATHDFFGQYSLSIGGDAAVIQAWINKRRDDLHKAHITRVGLKGPGYAGFSWLEIK